MQLDMKNPILRRYVYNIVYSWTKNNSTPGETGCIFVGPLWDLLKVTFFR